jgi:hypothetical protein
MRVFNIRGLIPCSCLVLASVLSGCGGDASQTGTAGTSGTTGTSAATGSTTTTASSGASSLTPSGGSSTTGAITLQWTAPTQNTDGTPITNLSGYEIHYGTESQDYTQTVQITNASATSYTVQNLPADTYYIAVTAYDSAGNESALSPEVTTKVD